MSGSRRCSPFGDGRMISQPTLPRRNRDNCGSAGVESAKQEVIAKCGVAFQPGITCAREYLRGIVELYPWLAREYAIVDIPTRYDGPVLAATATSSSFPTAAAGGVYFRGPVPGHWIAVTRRVDGLHVVDDSKTTKGLPGPEFALAAVVVRKGEADTFRAPVRESGRCAQTSKKSGNRQCGNSIVPGFDFCPAHLYVERGEEACKARAGTSRGARCEQGVVRGLDACPWHVTAKAWLRNRTIPAARSYVG